MNTKPTTLLSLRLPPDLVEEIDVAARDECRSRNSQIQHLLRRALGRTSSQRDRAGHAETAESAAHG